MGWRSIVINNPAELFCKNSSLNIKQLSGTVTVPLEDISVILLNHPQIIITSHLLASAAEKSISIISVNKNHIPNGLFLSYLPHSRALKIMRMQLSMPQPQKKRIWQIIIKQKLINQAMVLKKFNHPEASEKLMNIANTVRSGDLDNREGYGAKLYFSTIFGKKFSRDRDCFENAAMNYGYSIVRGIIAQTLVSYGFLTAFGLHHHSEQNSFNLADDLLEPFRPSIDTIVIQLASITSDMTPDTKNIITSIIHADIPRILHGETEGVSTLITVVDAMVISLGQAVESKKPDIILPGVVVLKK